MTYNPNVTTPTARIRHALPAHLEDMISRPARRMVTPPPAPVVTIEAKPDPAVAYEQAVALTKAKALIKSLEDELAEWKATCKKLQARVDAFEQGAALDYRKRPARAQSLVKIAASHLDLPVGLIESHSRKKGAVAGRQIICWLLRRHTTLSLPQIGRLVGKRDHSTVLHACTKVEATPDLLARAQQIETLTLQTEKEIYNV